MKTELTEHNWQLSRDGSNILTEASANGSVLVKSRSGKNSISTSQTLLLNQLFFFTQATNTVAYFLGNCVHFNE